MLKLPSYVNNVNVAPAVVMRVKVRSGVLQKTTLLGTATILRRVLFPKEPLVICYDSLP